MRVLALFFAALSTCAASSSEYYRGEGQGSTSDDGAYEFAGTDTAAGGVAAVESPTDGDVSFRADRLSSSPQLSVVRKTYVGSRFPGDETPFSIQKQWNVQFDLITVYRPIESVGYDYIRTDGKRLQLVTEMYKSIGEIANGAYDKQVRALAQDIAKKGDVVWIRMFHEFNSNTYPWNSLGKVQTFKTAWRRLVNIYRQERAPVKFQLCFLGTNSGNDKTPFIDFNPGDSYVDQVGVDVYVNNHSKLVPLKDKLNAGVYDQLSKFGKPIFFGELGVTQAMPDRAGWIYEAWKTLALDFPKVQSVSWFLECKSTQQNWCLTTQAEKDAFVRGLKLFKRLTI